MEQNMDRNCGEGMHHSGVKHILPFLAIPLVIGLVRGFARHQFEHMSQQQRSEWKNGVPPMFAELHRRAHAAETEKPAETQTL